MIGHPPTTQWLGVAVSNGVGISAGLSCALCVFYCFIHYFKTITMYTDSFNSEVNSINKYNKIITLRGMDYVIPDYSSSYHQYLTLEQLTLKLGEQSIVAGGDVSYLILDEQRCSASSLSLSIESKHCCALNDFLGAIFFLYREGEEHPITSFEEIELWVRIYRLLLRAL